MTAALLTLLLAVGPAITTSANDAAPANPAAAVRFEPVLKDTFHNAHRVTDKLISGDQPEGDAAFKALADLGVKTIISVDGAAPDAPAAKKHGMRYVHLPIGYDGVPEAQGEAIAKAIDELPGQIYLHCHHGKHRAAAAVAVACVYNGRLKPEDAEALLKTFGTGENYKGLWKDARSARPLEAGVLRRLDVKYVEKAKIPALAESMVQIDSHWDNVTALQKAGWQLLKDHPDVDPPHEVLQVEEHLHEIGRGAENKDRPKEFRVLLAAGEARVIALREALHAKPINRSAADAAFKSANASCTDCHREFRD